VADWIATVVAPAAVLVDADCPGAVAAFVLMDLELDGREEVFCADDAAAAAAAC
jgi:hypothetical protein